MQTLPRAASPADHRLHVSCYGQYGDQAGPGEGACAFVPRTWPCSGLALLSLLWPAGQAWETPDSFACSRLRAL